VARQSWYRGTGIPNLVPVGFFRLEDPAGEVGMETHLVSDGTTLYQLPLTYRGTALQDGDAGMTEALVATAEHSVLGTRWIYDATADPVWTRQLLLLACSNAVSEPADRPGIGPAEARGRRLMPELPEEDMLSVELVRVLNSGCSTDESGVAALVLGTWHPDGPAGVPATGCLAVVRIQAHRF
jgi:hypothetical protein